jgi:hypothetical protein
VREIGRFARQRKKANSKRGEFPGVEEHRLRLLINDELAVPNGGSFRPNELGLVWRRRNLQGARDNPEGRPSGQVDLIGLQRAFHAEFELGVIVIDDSEFFQKRNAGQRSCAKERWFPLVQVPTSIDMSSCLVYVPPAFRRYPLWIPGTLRYSRRPRQSSKNIVRFPLSRT